MLLNIFNGFCMSLADSVPGVSGGTIAFILGFYKEFLDSIHFAFSGNKNERIKALKFLGKLGIGWAIGMSISVTVLTKLFEQNIYLLSSVFIGLTFASIPFIINSEKKNILGKYQNIIFTLLGTLLVVAISFLRQILVSGSSADLTTSINFSALSLGQILYLFISGAAAITAMVLPGISGSTLLLIFGVYVPTISAIKQFISLNFGVIPGIMALGFGIVFGLFVSIKGIRIALEHHYSKMLYMIIGLMLGSFYAIAMGPTTLDTPLPPLSPDTFSIIGFILGVCILLGLEGIKTFLERKTQDK